MSLAQVGAPFFPGDVLLQRLLQSDVFFGLHDDPRFLDASDGF
jgi:hypothetical protein